MDGTRRSPACLGIPHVGLTNTTRGCGPIRPDADSDKWRRIEVGASRTYARDESSLVVVEGLIFPQSWVGIGVATRVSTVLFLMEKMKECGKWDGCVTKQGGGSEERKAQLGWTVLSLRSQMP